jgi:hypothetical protein
MARGGRLLVVLTLAIGLGGCAAATTAISKRNLDVQTRMSETVFLDPAPPRFRTVLVDIRNTSDKPDFDLRPAIVREIEMRGYRVVDDPGQAQYMLQANVLQAGKSTESAAESAYNSSFGSVLVGGAAGGAAGYGLGKAGGSDVGLTIAGALLGAMASAIADAFVSDTTYTVITDLQISERARSSVTVTETDQQHLPQGTAGSRSQTSTDTTDWKRYRTRIVSKAEKANLEWAEATPDLIDGMTRSIAGIF